MQYLTVRDYNTVLKKMFIASIKHIVHTNKRGIIVGAE